MTAQQLVDLLCASAGKPASPAGGSRMTRRDEETACTIHAGFAGYPFADDGYEFQGRATSQVDPILTPDPSRLGLRIWPEVGDWPLVVYLHAPEECAIVEYCEADLSVRIYDDEYAYREACRKLVAEHPCP